MSRPKPAKLSPEVTAPTVNAPKRNAKHSVLRRVFVASSKEGLAHAVEVGKVLRREGIECVLWTEIFEPGSLTFEALEEMLMDCCAAVFVVTPDDEGVIRSRRVRMPRANVMLEFGLVAGRLGRHNIALCCYGVAELPSDLAGLSVVKMDAHHLKQPMGKKLLREGGEEQLRRWCSQVLPTAERVARTEIVHGYTGTWDFDIEVETWRGLAVREPSYVHVHGLITLWISADGLFGAGNAHGRLSFKMIHGNGRKTADRKTYNGELNVAHEMQTVECRTDGGLILRSRVHSIQLLATDGPRPAKLDGLHGPPEPWVFLWTLACTPIARTLEGTLITDSAHSTKGRVTATKKIN